MTSARVPGAGPDLVLAASIGAVALFAGLALLALLLAIARRLERRARDRSIHDIEALPVEARPDLVVVLGCPPRTRSGRINPHLTGRALAAARAYHALRGVTMLCSGRMLAPDAADASAQDEAAALATLLEAAGVPSSAIRLDRDARRTIDSVERALDHDRGRPVLIVSQAFHLPRVLFLARALSLDAWGLAAPGPRLRCRGRVRESFAGLRALFDIGFARRGR
ncbi:MAG: ElyC/SanA/YdcF family protein [Myxococcota bacterium]